MHAITTFYRPFLSAMAKYMHENFKRTTSLSSSQMLQITSAIFGFKSYEAAKFAKLDIQLGIIEGKTFPNDLIFQAPDLELAEKRIDKVAGPLPDLVKKQMLTTLYGQFINECGHRTGFIERMKRQLEHCFDKRTGHFEESVFLTPHDWSISGEAVFSGDYQSFLWQRLPWFEFEAIAVSKITKVYEDEVHQLNADIIANILACYVPDFITRITGKIIPPNFSNWLSESPVEEYDDEFENDTDEHDWESDEDFTPDYGYEEDDDNFEHALDDVLKNNERT